MTGFITKIKLLPTKHRYHDKTVFIDHHIGINSIYLQRGIIVNETIQSKRSFKAYTIEKYVSVKNYHADNRRFVDN